MGKDTCKKNMVYTYQLFTTWIEYYYGTYEKIRLMSLCYIEENGGQRRLAVQ